MLLDTSAQRRNTAAPKLLGNFGEGLVTYNLIRKGFEVAHVDHVGADLIAERDKHRIAVSVKTRMYKAGSIESRGIVVDDDHLEKLEFFARRFDLEPVFAHAACIQDDKIIHLFMLRVADLKANFDKRTHGYSISFSQRNLKKLIEMACVDYSCWANESIGCKLFT